MKLDETYDNFQEENAPARTVISLQSGLIIHPMGISQPINIITHPRYIIISARKENIMVVIGASKENPPNDALDTAMVALIANTDASMARIKYRTAFFILSLGFFIVELISPKATMPKVAKADNHKDMSIIEFGFMMHMTSTATDKDVSESLLLDIR